MSPEQIQQTATDPRSDIFCAGILLWETTLTRRLFAADNQLAVISLVADCQIPRPTSIDPHYPTDLETVVLKALAKKPEDRFRTAAELEAALRAILANYPTVAKEHLGALVAKCSATGP